MARQEVKPCCVGVYRGQRAQRSCEVWQKGSQGRWDAPVVKAELAPVSLQRILARGQVKNKGQPARALSGNIWTDMFCCTIIHLKRV